MASRRRWMLALVLLLLGANQCGDSQRQESAACGPYPDQGVSLYVLPYPVGAAYTVGQGNCSDGSHAKGTAAQYAYDFLLPISSQVVAARGGTVIAIEESFSDTDHTNGHENFVDIQHPDGTVGAYVHLTNDGALVAVGDIVARGDAIALSGNSGNSSAPHLHFAVHGCGNCPSVAVTFRNTRAHPNGLKVGEAYTAEAYSIGTE